MTKIRIDRKRRRQSAGRALVILLLALVLGGGLLGGTVSGAGPAEETDSPVFIQYTLDRSAVPQWVKKQVITLRIHVGQVDEIRLWADGQPLPVFYDAILGDILVTTDAETLTLGIQGESLDVAHLGAYEITALRDDKLWAYSLTFDDGEYSVYEHAFPELARYGYRAAVAVIGLWMDEPDWRDPQTYCRPEQILEMVDAGWSVFNHSYMHWNAPSEIDFEDAQRAQEAIYNQLNGYEAMVFTVPYTNELWDDVINTHSEALGIHLSQRTSDDGFNPTTVDHDYALGNGLLRLGRDDISKWSSDSKDLFGRAHGLATLPSPQHAWLSLHGHRVTYDQDWCDVAASTAYLYHTYGAGGTDEVWVAPADEVLQYLVTRTYIQVTRQAITAQDLGDEQNVPMMVTYREGAEQSAGLVSWDDTYIDSWYPGSNFDGDGVLLARSGEGKASVLIRAEFTPPKPGAQVMKAMLHLYASERSNDVAAEVQAFEMLTEWAPDQATWYQAQQDVPWTQAGALADADRRALPSASARVDGCDSGARWYTFDVTQMVSGWLQNPEQNHGLLLQSVQNISKAIWFSSGNHMWETARPMLQVWYEWPIIEPTPTATPTATATVTATAPPTVAPSPTFTATPTPYHSWLPLVWR